MAAGVKSGLGVGVHDNGARGEGLGPGVGLLDPGALRTGGAAGPLGAAREGVRVGYLRTRAVSDIERVALQFLDPSSEASLLRVLYRS